MGTKFSLVALSFRRRVVMLCILIQLAIFVWIGAAGGGLACSFLHGTCQYDPRTQHPNFLFVSQPPEQAVARYVRDQVQRSGTFPITSTQQVASIEPVWVSAWGFYTDWHVQADVRLRISYSGGNEEEFNFELLEKSASTILGLENTTMFAVFGPIERCNESYAHIWHCN
jgi:hypothetical protein